MADIPMTPQMADASRDGLALVRAALDTDVEGMAAVLAGAELSGLRLTAFAMAHWLAGALNTADDPDAALARFRESIGL